uniref:Uncharacterized protein n=1 Tax=Amphimedon queenslandica TaxID=400682 RepID=A0A1X7UL88_AMPQE
MRRILINNFLSSWFKVGFLVMEDVGETGVSKTSSSSSSNAESDAEKL